RQVGGEVALLIRPFEGEGILILAVARQPARVWESRGGTDAPQLLATNLAYAEAEQRLRNLNRKDKGEPGPVRLRGDWKAQLSFEGSQPIVLLTRQVATYGTLTVRGAKGGWTLVFDRKEQWFTKAENRVEERSFPHLVDAVEAGMNLMMGSVAQACTFRDTHRRNAVDPDYAAKHPPKAPAAPADPIANLKPRRSHYDVKELPGVGFVVRDEAGNEKARFGAREKGKANKYAAALNKGQDPNLATAPPADAPPALSEVSAPQPPACPISTANIAKATQQEAEALGGLADSLWGETEGPELLRRAAKLIRHGQSLARSPLCTGPNQKAALEHVEAAAKAYNTAREAVLNGENPDVVKTLRKVAEQISLAAAKAAKACSQGKATPDKPAAKAPKSGADKQPPAKPAADKPAAPKPAKTPPAAKTGTSSSLPPITTEPGDDWGITPQRSAAPAEEEVDPAKDAMLYGVFERVLKAALAEQRDAA
ncbi:MAG TPA: hypothetical protein PKY30_06575, partial [Myxococcota bacterium]|nr:hypothetical protein [Myxococcota bacterium]